VRRRSRRPPWSIFSCGLSRTSHLLKTTSVTRRILIDPATKSQKAKRKAVKMSVNRMSPCPKCGAQTDVGASFCNKCGLNLKSIFYYYPPDYGPYYYAPDTVAVAGLGVAAGSFIYTMYRDYATRRRCINCSKSTRFKVVPACSPNGYWLGYWYDACNNCGALNPHKP
jgi:hypothetical protein